MWVEAVGSRGRAKTRPVVIITDTSQIVLDARIVAVAVTTTFPEPAPDTHVELPWHPRGHLVTGLCRRSAAVCNWIVSLTPGSIQSVAGGLSMKLTLRIVERVNSLNI